jgi:hypothetical protein
VRLYLKVLAGFYLFGFILHVLDLLGLRLKFSDMDYLWQSWIIFLIVGDLIAAIGLWRPHCVGVITFQVIALSQLIAYTVYRDVFGEQYFLIVFHVVTILAFYLILIFGRNQIAPWCQPKVSGTKT